jgi:hypothetical protein
LERGIHKREEPRNVAGTRSMGIGMETSIGTRCRVDDISEI